jgi:aryl-alcohol dehydrogenase-like predicted oxidoreductase
MAEKQLLKKIGLGSVQFGLNYGISNKQGITHFNEVRKILTIAKEKGIDLIDTAYAYGKSERTLGRIGISSFKTITKFIAPTPRLTLPIQIETSLRRLKIKTLYGLLAHEPLTILEDPSIWEQLLKLKQTKIVEKIGFSFNAPDEAYILIDKGFFPDIVQVPFNYFDDRFQLLMKQLNERGCEVHARSAFLQGLFFMNPEHLDPFFDDVKPVIRHLQTYGENLPGMLLKYCLQKSFINKVIFGVNNRQQLIDNLSLIELSDDLPGHNFKINHEILTPSKWPKN